MSPDLEGLGRYSVWVAFRKYRFSMCFNDWNLRRERRTCLFSIEPQFPKPDVGGSIPVSRSIFSTTYREPHRRQSPIESINQRIAEAK